MDTLFALFSGIIIAFTTSYLTVRFALRQFYSQKWWEYKKQTYTDLVEALYYVAQYSETITDEVLEGRMVPDETRSDRGNRYVEAHERLNKVGAIGTFMVSHKVEAILLGFRLELARTEREVPEDDYVGRLIAEHKAAQQCLDEVKAAALEDLNVSSEGLLKRVRDAASRIFHA